MAIFFKKKKPKTNAASNNVAQPFKGISTSNDMALSCLDNGIAPIPILKGEKRPEVKGWPNMKVSKEQVPELFPAGSNIGILLGEPSNGIVDIDLDSTEAVALAPAFLPQTSCMFGRKSNPASHYVYEADGDIKTTKFQVKEEGVPHMLLEVRSTGTLTMAPPSVHPDGEQSRFEKGKAGLPSKVPAKQLMRNVTMLTIASLLKRVWPHKGSHCRHEVALSVAGGLLRAGFTLEEVKLIIGKVAANAGDDEVESRLKDVETTDEKIKANQPVTGWPTAADSIGEGAVKTLMKWSGVGQPLSEMAIKELVDGAKETMAGVKAAVQDDPGVPFTSDAIKALYTLDKHDKPEFMRVKSELKKAGVPALELNKALKELHAQHTNGKGQTDTDDAQYVVKGGCICHRKVTKNGSIEDPLCNFSAQIVEEVVQDDGLDKQTCFAIEGKMEDGHQLNRVFVPAAQFSSMGWPSAQWGAKPIINPGSGTKEQLRAAIQRLSPDVPRLVTYQHTGWRFVNGKWVFFHGAGAIGPDGVEASITVDLGFGNLRHIQLPALPEGEDLIKAIRRSLRFLEVATDSVSMPLFMGVYRAPLGEALTVDFSIFVEGKTGTYKSAITGVLQAHFGPGFDGRSFPINWSGTANSLEKSAFLAKDIVIVADDFCPTGSQGAVSALHQTADRLLRAQGNLGGRSRMNPDGTLKADYYPRGLIISTGEDIPKGASLRGRMLIVEVKQGAVNLEVLSELQNAAAQAILAQVIAGYTHWLAPKMDTLKLQMSARKDELRTKIGKLGHSRTPDIVASLMVSWEMFLDFAMESGAIDDTQCAELTDRGWEAVKAAAMAQSSHLRSEDPIETFLEMLQSVISSGRAHLKPLTPIGMHLNMTDGDMIGWIDDDSVYLNPGAAFATLKRFARDQGSSLLMTQTTLWKRLKEQGMLASVDETRGRNQVRKTIGEKVVTVIHLHRKDVLPTTKEVNQDQDIVEEDAVV